MSLLNQASGDHGNGNGNPMGGALSQGFMYRSGMSQGYGSSGALSQDMMSGGLGSMAPPYMTGPRMSNHYHHQQPHQQQLSSLRPRPPHQMVFPSALPSYPNSFSTFSAYDGKVSAALRAPGGWDGGLGCLLTCYVLVWWVGGLVLVWWVGGLVLV